MIAKANDVSKALREHVKPLLNDAGFDDVAGRKFWRRKNEKIDHVEIASLSTYRAFTNNATTASFYVSVGISLPQYGIRLDPFHKDHITDGPKGPRPRESQMPIRGVICPPSSPQLTKGRWGWEFASLWRIETVNEADEAAIALAEEFRAYALDWLDTNWDLNAILELLQSDQKKLLLAEWKNGSHLWLDAEMPWSKIRKAHIEMVQNALAQGD